MRITDINTTDMYMANDEWPCRVIQLGPRHGGRLWRMNALGSLAIGDVYNSLYHGREGHLAVQTRSFSILKAAQDALKGLTLPEWTGDDVSDIAMANDWEQAINSGHDIEPFNLAVVDTRRLTSGENAIAKEVSRLAAMERAKRVAKHRRRQVDEARPHVAALLRLTGMSQTDIDRIVAEIPWYSGLDADVKIPLRLLTEISLPD